MPFSYGAPVSDDFKPKPKKPDFMPVCLNCGYEMRGNQSGVCPECGEPFVYRDWERAVRDVKQQIGDMEGGLIGAKYAWVVAIVAIAMRGTGILLLEGSCFGTLIRVVSFVAGIAAFLLSLNVFRVGKIPVWARGHVETQPAYGSALVGIVGGAVLITAAVVFK